jgi:hypothetical protein
MRSANASAGPKASTRKPREAKAFYGVIALATLGGMALNLHRDRSDEGALLGRGGQRPARPAADGGDDAVIASNPRGDGGPGDLGPVKLKIGGWLSPHCRDVGSQSLAGVFLLS